MQQIQVIVSMKVPAGKRAALQNLIPSITERVKSGEPDTLLYRWYFNADGSQCHLHECFPSEESFLHHLKNVEPVLADLFGLAPISGWKIFGTVSAETAEGLRAFGASQNIQPEFFAPENGFVRLGEKSMAFPQALSSSPLS
ncbi:hypothetical protein HRH25_04510 [Flavisolibacter sp. BT320]|nr:hypothetical protein [Flavisolibacter longurius]